MITMAQVYHAFILCNHFVTHSLFSIYYFIILAFSNVLREGAHYQIPCYSALWDIKLVFQTPAFGLLFGMNFLFQN